MLLILLFTIAIVTLSTVLFVKSNRKAGSSFSSGQCELVFLSSELGLGAEADPSSRSIEDLVLAIGKQLSFLDHRESLIGDDQFLNYKEQVIGIIRNRLEEAVRLWDHSTIVHLTKLLKPLGLQEEGLQRFVCYLKNVVPTRYRAKLTQLSHSDERPNGNSEVNPVTCVMYLSQDIVSAIDENSETLSYLGGQLGIVYAVCELQEECDSWASNMLDVFPYCKFFREKHSRVEHPPDRKDDSRRKLAMERNFQEMRWPKKRPFTAAYLTHPTEPQEIDVYIQGMISLAHCSKDCKENMMSLILLDHPQLCRKASSAIISHYYVELEKMYMETGVDKAIRINERVPNSHVSSMVDDAFCVLWTSCTRAISTSNSTWVQRVLSHAVYILEGVYINSVKPNFPKRHIPMEIVTALNNCEGSSTKALKLQRRLKERCEEAFSTPADLNVDIFCVESLDEYWVDSLNRVSSRFQKTFDDGMERLRKLTRSRIESILESVETTNTDGEAVVDRLIDALENNVVCLKPEMTAENYVSFLYPVSELIVEWLPGTISTLNFSKGGHEQLRKKMIKLATLIRSIIPERHTKDVPDVGVEQLMTNIKSRTEPVLQSIKRVNAAYDEDNPWVERLIDVFAINVALLEPLMTATNYDTLVYSVIFFIVTWLRDGIFTLRFSEGGHQQLLRDISKLARHLSTMTRISTDDLLDVLIEKIAATVTPQVRPCVETISSSSPGWLQGLIDSLNTNVAWLEPLMNRSHYNTFTFIVIDSIVTRLDRIVISLELNEGEQIQLRSDMRELTIHVSSMCGRPMITQLSTLKHLSHYQPPLLWHWPAE